MLDYDFHITTPRLYISHFDPENDSHCDYVCEVVHSVDRKDADKTSKPSLEDREVGRQFIATGVEKMARIGYGRFLISLRPQVPMSSANPPSQDNDDGEEISFSQKSKEPIGTVSMQLARHPNAPTIPDIGFGLSPQHHGKGYATEAAQALLTYFEEIRGQREFAGYCMPENVASANVFRRLGFEERGVWEMDGVLGEGKMLRALVWTKGVGGEEGVLEGYGLVKVEGMVE